MNTHFGGNKTNPKGKRADLRKKATSLHPARHTRSLRSEAGIFFSSIDLKLFAERSSELFNLFSNNKLLDPKSVAS